MIFFFCSIIHITSKAKKKRKKNIKEKINENVLNYLVSFNGTRGKTGHIDFKLDPKYQGVEL